MVFGPKDESVHQHTNVSFGSLLCSLEFYSHQKLKVRMSRALLHRSVQHFVRGLKVKPDKTEELRQTGKSGPTEQSLPKICHLERFTAV